MSAKCWLVVGVLCPGNIKSTNSVLEWSTWYIYLKIMHRFKKSSDYATLIDIKVYPKRKPSLGFSSSTQTEENVIQTWYPTRSYYPDSTITSPYPILYLSSARLGSNKYQFYKSLVWVDALPMWKSYPVISYIYIYIYICLCMSTMNTNVRNEVTDTAIEHSSRLRSDHMLCYNKHKSRSACWLKTEWMVLNGRMCGKS